MKKIVVLTGSPHHQKDQQMPLLKGQLKQATKYIGLMLDGELMNFQ